MSSPRLSVVIPTLGRLASLSRTLDHLDAQTAAKEAFEVIVVADAAISELDGLERLTRGRDQRVRRLQASLPGASAARNAGWRAATAPLLLFTDDDILAGPELIDEHLEWHRREPSPEVGVLGHVRWARGLKVTPFMRWLEHGIQFNFPSISGHETGWGNFYTANVSVKRALVERAGGFDEQRLPYLYEDLDLALRMHRHGFRLLYNRAAVAEHLQVTDLQHWRSRVRQLAVSERRFTEIHPEIPAYFHDMFRAAEAARPAPRSAERLARWVPRWVPLLGPWVWSRADLFYRQALAGPFLAGWEAATRKPGSQVSVEGAIPPSPGGSRPGGPK